MENDKDLPVMQNDLSSKLTGLNKEGISKKQKLMLIAGIIAFPVIIAGIILIIVAISGASTAGKKSKIGEINCIYEIDTITKTTEILGKDFTKNSDFDILVDGKKVKYSKEIKFNSFGEQAVQFIIYGNLEMKNMFKDVKSLISVNMTSEKNGKILSITSAFENCQNLVKFTFSGFDTSKITSFYKKFF